MEKSPHWEPPRNFGTYPTIEINITLQQLLANNSRLYPFGPKIAFVLASVDPQVKGENYSHFAETWTPDWFRPYPYTPPQHLQSLFNVQHSCKSSLCFPFLLDWQTCEGRLCLLRSYTPSTVPSAQSTAETHLKFVECRNLGINDWMRRNSGGTRSGNRRIRSVG